MPVKYLFGAYPGGYSLAGSYSGLVIEASASVGGAGVVAGVASISNLGVVNATNYGVSLSGGILTNGDPLHASALIEGSTAVSCATAADVLNDGTIIGRTGIGALLSGGGSLTNGSATDLGATIDGAINGVQIGGAATVDNFGTIQGQIVDGVVLTAGGSITNGSASDTHAAIIGYNSGVLAEGAATIANYGVIRGAPFYGVRLTAGGLLTNGSAADATATISGQLGVAASGAAATVVNFGTISGGAAGAVVFTAAGCVLEVHAGCAFVGAVSGDFGTLDLASGTGTIDTLSGGSVVVSGSMAATTFSSFGTVEIAAGADFTVAPSGTLGGGGTDALVDNGVLGLYGGASFDGTFDQGAAGVLTLLPDAGGKVVLSGQSHLAGTVTGKGVLSLSAVALAGLVVDGKVSLVIGGDVDQTGALVAGAQAKSVDTLTLMKRASWTLDGDVGISMPHLDVEGALAKSAGAGTSLISALTVDDGSIVATSGVLEFSRTVTGIGALTVGGGATLRIDSGAAASLTMMFRQQGGVLALEQPATFAAAISGFAAGDVIDILGRKVTAAALGPGDTLVLSKGKHTVATLQLQGDYSGYTFSVAADGFGGTNITVASAGERSPPSAQVGAGASAFVDEMARLGAASDAALAHGGPAQGAPLPRLAHPTA